MGFEDTQATGSVPENNSATEDLERTLKEKLLSLELEYSAKLSQKEIPFPDGNTEELSFEDILKRYSDISAKIHDSYVERTGKVPTGEDGEFEKITGEILAKIHHAYDSSPSIWTSQISSLIENVIKTLPESPTGQAPENKKEVLRTGLLRYETRTALGGLEGLAKAGITEGDECIMIHFDPFYKQRASGVTLSLSESFQKLADDISAHYPQIKAVIYESWIADSPMGRRIGFHEFQSQFEHFYHGDTFWGQFYDMDGQIIEKRTAKLLETGKAPFKVKGGYLLTSEFLEKYPPKEKP